MKYGLGTKYRLGAKYGLGAAAAVALSLCAASGALADHHEGRKQAKYKKEDLLTSKMIARKGGVEMKIDGYGMVKVVELVSAKSKTCTMVVPAFKKMIGDMNPKKGIKITIDLEAIPLTNSDGTTTIYCEGGGEGCKATVETFKIASPM